MSLSKMALKSFSGMFGRTHAAVIGMIHVGALPGTPRNKQKISEITEAACKEAEIYKEAGVDGIIVENMHDIPYMHTDSVGHEITASMSVICSHIKGICPNIPCGVQILAGANKQALSVAQAAGFQFIRAEGFVFAHVADEGIMNCCAGELLRYRKQIGADDVQVFTDIKKKHSSHAITADINIADTAKAAEFFLSDGVVVTGGSTGMATDTKELQDVLKAVNIPVLIGSGVTIDNMEHYMSANALIIGSYFKHGGSWENDVELPRVKAFMEKIQRLREK